MTEKATVCLDTLRKAAHISGSFDCHDCLAYAACPTGTAGWNNECIFDTAVDLIESLSAELELIEAVAAQARGLECERDMLAAELEHVKYERDAAVKDLKEFSYYPCLTCKHRTGVHYCEKFGERTPGRDMNDVIFCGQYEWRGVKETEHGM